MLKAGIVGLPNVGKSTLFNALLSREIANTAKYPFCTIDPNIGVVELPDPRPAQLAKIEGSHASYPAVVEFVDIAGLVKDAHQGEGLGNQFLGHIREVDALVHVLRYFDNPDVLSYTTHGLFHDYTTVVTELLLADLRTLEKHRPSRTISTSQIHTQETVQKAIDHIDKGHRLSRVSFTPAEIEVLKPLCLLTIKPEIIVINIDEKHLSDLQPILNQVPNLDALPICAKLEQELIDLSEPERKQYLQTINISKTGLELLISRTFKLLDLITFLTVNKNEARSWSIKRGSTYWDAAGLIHSDIQEGFVKAIVCPYTDFIQAGGWSNSMQKGLTSIQSKNGLVSDDEVIEFKFTQY